MNHIRTTWSLSANTNAAMPWANAPPLPPGGSSVVDLRGNRAPRVGFNGARDSTGESSLMRVPPSGHDAQASPGPILSHCGAPERRGIRPPSSARCGHVVLMCADGADGTVGGTTTPSGQTAHAERTSPSLATNQAPCAANSSSNAFASFRSSVSKPSVNQP
jgi:hypothetical protein